jgi:NADH-quinone oxidoreductase subunit F
MILKKYIEKRVNSIEEYRGLGGLKGLEQTKHRKKEEIVEEIKRSELRGRAGAGFSTGFKLEMGLLNFGLEKYVICNADEGEVGTFKDRELLKNCPYLVLEGLIIAGLAIGAKKGYVYLRDEYTYMKEYVEKAILDVEHSVLKSSGFTFEINLRIGAGAYICGEETSLIESVEEKRGEPRLKPPFPPQAGLFQSPTIILNVETLSNLPWIMVNGADAFLKIGTEKSRGTKLFSVSGDVKNPGVYELPMGVKLRVLVEEYAGAENVKAVQVGGASGRIVAGNDLDRSLCFEDVLGAGAVIVFDESRSMVRSMCETMAFFMEESCGKCTPCREGNWVLHEILDRMCSGRGRNGDIQEMREIASAMIDTAFCGLGTTAPTSLLDSLDLFEDEFKGAVAV